MHIVHLAAELAPLAKIGGLGDVVFGLSRETMRLGHQVTVIIPKYDLINTAEIQGLEKIETDLPCHFEGQNHLTAVWKGKVEGIDTIFIDPLHPRMFFSRGCIYGCDDDIDRFLYFCQASTEYIKSLASPPDILHLHDWQTAIVATLYKTQKFKASKIILTLHNLEHQGRCTPYEMEKVGLDIETYFTQNLLQDPLYPEAANLLKGGILYSDFISTVSPTYASEIKTVELGEGLDGLLTSKGKNFKGILNGIDFGYWNPETDPMLPAHFSAKEIATKGYLKKRLREKLNLAEVNRPVVASICRLVPQKGIDIIRHALNSSVEMGAQIVLLGSSPIPQIDAEFHTLRQQLRDHPHISINLKHEESLAHLIYAGSDMLIAPSRFEPCGLTQLIALRYGTVPIVRETGGLADTINDINDADKPENLMNGFTFKEPTIYAFDYALKRAIHLWYHHPDQWWKLKVNGMLQDFSWTHSAKDYIKVYQSLVDHSPL